MRRVLCGRARGRPRALVSSSRTHGVGTYAQQPRWTWLDAWSRLARRIPRQADGVLPGLLLEVDTPGARALRPWARPSVAPPRALLLVPAPGGARYGSTPRAACPHPCRRGGWGRPTRARAPRRMLMFRAGCFALARRCRRRPRRRQAAFSAGRAGAAPTPCSRPTTCARWSSPHRWPRRLTLDTLWNCPGDERRPARLPPAPSRLSLLVDGLVDDVSPTWVIILPLDCPQAFRLPQPPRGVLCDPWLRAPALRGVAARTGQRTVEELPEAVGELAAGREPHAGPRRQACRACNCRKDDDVRGETDWSISSSTRSEVRTGGDAVSRCA